MARAGRAERALVIYREAADIGGGGAEVRGGGNAMPDAAQFGRTPAGGRPATGRPPPPPPS